MKFFSYTVVFLVISGSVFGKDKSILVGSSIWMSPEIGYDSVKVAENDGLNGVEEEYKTSMGISAEFVAPQPDGNFLGLGLDVFFKSKYKENPNVKIAPISVFANFGILEPYCVNLNARLFAGIGGMFLNYKTLHHKAEFDDSLGWMYQFGLGIITPKLFVDVLMRGGLGSLERNFEGINSIAESDYSFSSAMLKIGLVF